MKNSETSRSVSSKADDAGREDDVARHKMRLKSASFNGRDSFRELTARQRVAGHAAGDAAGHVAGHVAGDAGAPLDTLQASPAPPLALANPRRLSARRSASSGENSAGLSLINRRTAAAGSGRGLASRREVPGLNRPGRGPGGFKLDMGALQRSRGERDFAREAQEAQARRDKFAFFEKDCSRVLEHVYVGSDFVARSREVLKEAGITHVLNCVGFVCPEYFPEEIKYKTLWLQDNTGEDLLYVLFNVFDHIEVDNTGEDLVCVLCDVFDCIEADNTGEDLVCVLYDVFDYIEAVRAARGRVFIHCCQGISRSTSLVIAYLMWCEGIPFGDAFKRVKALRAVANPNMGFACQLLQWQTRILPPSALDPPPTPQPTALPPAAPAPAAAPAAAVAATASGVEEASGAASSCHMYRMAPHSPYDALHLVPKITTLSRHSLDPRGAFIVQIRTKVYCWRGKECHPLMAKQALAAAAQIIKYERLGEVSSAGGGEVVSAGGGEVAFGEVTRTSASFCPYSRSAREGTC
ncbi:unnamed protein product [Closterium sp. NIES-64]|nr:unnamed protein product [Closterium sp. NIES-64]